MSQQQQQQKQKQHLLSALSPASIAHLRWTSYALVASIKVHLQDPSGATFLPSYTHKLPSGSEAGTVLAVDLGGSTLRVAVISLPGRDVVQRQEWGITDAVRRLPGTRFFDWVAMRINEVVTEDKNMGVGLTWSFPIIQTSEGSGEIQQMGKGFRIFEGIVGSDMRMHFEAALKRRSLHSLRLISLINDTAATLLAHAYDHPKTRISLICGTGVNIALLLPVSVLHAGKFGKRPEAWTKAAQRVLVNTECSMLGGGIFPVSVADQKLDGAAEAPGFQPFEQFTGGRYLGEVARLTLVEAGLKCEGKWTLKSEVMAGFEVDTTVAAKAFERIYNVVLTPKDVEYVAAVCRAVVRRAAAYLAVMLYAFYQVLETEETVVVACCGAVVEKHPTARKQCQGFLDALAGRRRMVLDIAEGSGLIGAAVGVVIATEGDRARL